VSPNFLYRIEVPPARAAAGTPAAARHRRRPRLSIRSATSQLASRLSFFLWSSIPDDQLLQLAERGQLHSRPCWRARFKAECSRTAARRPVVDNFAGQWLKLRAVDTQEPYDLAFPDYDASLQSASSTSSNSSSRASTRTIDRCSTW